MINLNNLIRLSVVMIVKNEEKHLERCLKSINGFANEVVIVDTGSTDKTIEIAKDYSCAVYKKEFEPFSFSLARNYAITRCIGAWILTIDADEQLKIKDRGEFERLVNSDDGKGVIVKVKSFREDSTQTFESLRLWKSNQRARYKGNAHEQIYPSLKRIGYEIIEKDFEIYHYGYDINEEQIEAKAKRNLDLLMIDHSNNPNWLTCYQIAQCFAILEDLGLAKLYATRSIQLNPPADYTTEINTFLSKIPA